MHGLCLSPKVKSWRIVCGRCGPNRTGTKEQFKKLESSDRFAAVFHLDRVLAYLPLQRSALLRQRTQYLVETLKQDAQNAAARLSNT